MMSTTCPSTMLLETRWLPSRLRVMLNPLLSTMPLPSSSGETWRWVVEMGFVSNDVQKDKVTVSLKTVANGVSIFDMSREKLEKTASVASIPVEMEISLQDLDKSTSSSSDVKWAWGWTLVSWLGVVGVLASAAALYHSVAQEDITRKDWRSAGKVVIKVPIKPRRD